MDGVGLSKSEHFLNPLKEVFVTGKRRRRITRSDGCTAWRFGGVEHCRVVSLVFLGLVFRGSPNLP